MILAPPPLVLSLSKDRILQERVAIADLAGVLGKRLG